MAYGLKTASQIQIKTDEGTRSIELLFGNVCNQPATEKVDIVMVSAFFGSYQPTATSLIGALKHYLDLDVGALAKDKALDLRRDFNCWLSKPLPSRLPFRKLLCFEMIERSNPAPLVSGIFRALISSVGNDDFSVITPLLATGDQHFAKPKMLRAMVKAAAFWIKTGLPMTRFMIVVYTTRPQQLTREEKELLEVFKTLKGELDSASELHQKFFKKKQERERAPDIRYDVFLSFSPADDSQARDVLHVLRRKKPDLKVYDSAVTGEEGSPEWLEQIRAAIIVCARFIAFLSPNYLATPTCLEQYNVARCTYMKTHRSLLAPFLLQTVDPLPTYMAMVQYIDCRQKSDKPGRMEAGLLEFIASLRRRLAATPSTDEASKGYDVFVSYSHKDPKSANDLVRVLQQKDSNLNIFIDRQELKSGSRWQETLYQAVEDSTCFIALINDHYITSAVCSEELAVAAALFARPESSLQLAAIPTAKCDLPPWLSRLQVSSRGHDVDFRRVLDQVASDVIKFVREGGRKHGAFADKTAKSLPSLSQVLEKHREEIFDTQISPRMTSSSSNDLQKPNIEFDRVDGSSGDVCDIVISTHSRTLKFADFLHDVLANRASGLRVKVVKSEGGTQAELGLLDTGRAVVVLLSRAYCQTPESREALHVILSRRRSSSLVYPVLVTWLPESPVYFSLVEARVALPDPCWHKLLQDELEDRLPEVTRVVNKKREVPLSDTQALALTAVAEDLLSLFLHPTVHASSQSVLLNVLELGKH